jgi:hypothetical protein
MHYPRMSPSPRDLAEMTAAIEGTEVAARQWLQAGFSPGDAAAYVRAGCFDVDRTEDLRRAHVTPSQIAALGLGWDFCAGKVPLSELGVSQGPQASRRGVALTPMLW